MQKVLFVCLGNICRSPLAEAIFNHKAKNMGLVADSAGTAAYHLGSSPDHRTVEVAEANGVPISHKARQFEVEDFETFDYIMAMDEHNFRDIKNLSESASEDVYLMRDFDDLAAGDVNVPDPYYGGYDGFELIYDMLDRSIDNLIKHITDQNKQR